MRIQVILAAAILMSGCKGETDPSVFSKGMASIREERAEFRSAYKGYLGARYPHCPNALSVELQKVEDEQDKRFEKLMKSFQSSPLRFDIEVAHDDFEFPKVRYECAPPPEDPKSVESEEVDRPNRIWSIIDSFQYRYKPLIEKARG